MTLMLAGAAFLAANALWHAGLAVLSVRASTGRDASVTPKPGGPAAVPQILWLVLIDPSSAALAAARAARLRPRCRTRVVVVTPEANGARPSVGGAVAWYRDACHLAVPPELDRATLLNRAVRLIWRRTSRAGEDPTRVVVGIIDEYTSPDENVAIGVWYAFADARVGAVQARIQTRDGGTVGAAEQYERGVLGDATNLLRGRRGIADLEATGSFVRLSALRALGRRPWQPGAIPDRDLGRRLRDLGLRIEHDPRLRVVVGSPSLSGVLRQQARWAQGLLPDSPLRRDIPWSERLAWAPRLCGWLLPAGVAVAVPAWLASTVAAGPQPIHVAAVWVGGVLAPALVWWGTRRDMTLPALARGALARPVLVALRPVALLWALGWQYGGRRAGSWVAHRRTGAPRSADARVWPASTPVRARPGPTRPAAASVFVDLTGRRQRRMGLAVRVAGVAGLAYMIAFGYALAGQPLVPDPAGPDPVVVDSPPVRSGPTGPVAQEPRRSPASPQTDGHVPVVDTGPGGPVRRGAAPPPLSPSPGVPPVVTPPSPTPPTAPPPTHTPAPPPPRSASPSVPASPPTPSRPAPPRSTPSRFALSLVVPPVMSVAVEVDGGAS